MLPGETLLPHFYFIWCVCFVLNLIDAIQVCLFDRDSRHSPHIAHSTILYVSHLQARPCLHRTTVAPVPTIPYLKSPQNLSGALRSVFASKKLSSSLLLSRTDKTQSSVSRCPKSKSIA